MLSRQDPPRLNLVNYLLLKSTGNNRQRGFTLLELIVVCALIGIMLSLSIPSLRNTFLSDPLKTTARKIIGLVAEVRQNAVREQQDYLLHISQGENRIWYEKDALLTEDEKKWEEEHQKQQLNIPETVTLSAVILGDSAVSSQDQAIIWISKRGYLEQTALQLTDDNGRSLSLQFYPFSDTITVSDQFPPKVATN